ncbi:acyltransferase family protein [Planococcus plakortidis]|uniref:acyltransferase family protein n=1 Tax=Planococcus plakortidis TaxID=1038856 RepID=UPI003984AB6D
MRRKLVLIQLSRALVPLLVMLHHLSTTMMDYYGFNIWNLAYLPLTGGVYYFFSLSGFMAYYIYRQKFGRKGQLSDFLVNRFIRIYPLYWVVTLAFLILAFLFPWFATGAERDMAVILTSIFLVPNPEWQDPFLIVAWSLEYTIYFYLMFSILFLSPRFIGKALFAFWGILSFLGATGIIYIDHFLFDFLFASYNLMFMAGVFCAWLILHAQILPVLGYLSMAIGLIGFPVTWMNALNPFMEISFEMSASISIMFLLVGLGVIDMNKEIHIPKAFHQLGNAAFAIYLVHNVVLDLFSEWMDQAGWHEVLGNVGMSLLLVVLMLFFGILAHFKLELPLHRLFKGWLRKDKATAVAASETGAVTKKT